MAQACTRAHSFEAVGSSVSHHVSGLEPTHTIRQGPSMSGHMSATEPIYVEGQGQGLVGTCLHRSPLLWSGGAQCESPRVPPSPCIRGYPILRVPTVAPGPTSGEVRTCRWGHLSAGCCSHVAASDWCVVPTHLHCSGYWWHGQELQRALL